MKGRIIQDANRLDTILDEDECRSLKVPKGRKKIMEIINGDLSNQEKISKIKKITSDRMGVRGASFLTLGLSRRSDDLKAFYALLDNMIDNFNCSNQMPPHTSTSLGSG